MAQQVESQTWRRELAATFAAASSEVLYVVRLQPDVVVEFVSPGVFGLLGYVPAEFYADPSLWSSVVDRDASDTVRELTLGEAGEESNGIVRWLGKNGRAVWVHHRWLVVTRDAGTKALYGAARALRAESRREDLAGQVDYLRLLLENVTDVVFDIAADGTFRWASPATEQVLGWRPGELIGKPSAHFIEPGLTTNGSTGPASPTGRRFRVRTFDGGHRWMAGLWRETRDGQGRLLGRIAGLHDIEDTVRAETELASSREHYRLLAENGSDLVFRTSPGPDFVCEWVSPSIAETLGWQPEDVQGRSINELAHPDDLRRHGADNVDTHDDRKGTFEIRVRTPSGRYRWMAATVRSLVDGSGEVVARVGSARDIETEVRARHELAQSERRFRLALESAPSGMAVVGLDRRFHQVNPALCRLTQRDETWLLDHSVHDVIHPDEHELDERMRQRLLSGESTSEKAEKRLLRSDGSSLWMDHAIGLLRDEAGEPLSFVCQFVDVSASRRARDHLTYLADHDPLTRLLTRRALEERLDWMLSQPGAPGSCLGVLYLDVDHFKETNDSYGHAAGDRLLVEVARRLTATARAGDLVARLGGDEIAVVLLGLKDTGDAEVVARKIHRALNEPVAIGPDVSVPAKVSIGVAVGHEGEPAERLLHHADLALYQAKRTGRNRTVRYTPDLE